MKKYNVNGTLFEGNDKVFDLKNRNFRYGDGVFETMRWINGRLPLYPFHVERLIRGMKTLQMEIPSYFNMHFLRHEIDQTLQSLEVADRKNARIRVWVWRDGEGTYTPTSNKPDFAIEVSPLLDSSWLLNDLGLTVGVYPTILLSPSILSNLKTCNASIYVLAALFAKRQLWDESILLNTRHEVAEGTASNLFWIKNDQIFTPPLHAGCVAGVLRSFLVENFKSEKRPIIEKNLTIDELREADEVFLTNAVQGIRWVETFENQTFVNDQTQLIFQKMKDKLKVIG